MAWNSKQKLFGLPLISFGFYAEGIIAVGFSGVGVITIAQFGIGFISITQVGMGVFTIAQAAIGIVAVAQVGIGLLFSFGQAALGFFAMGESTAGYYTLAVSYDIGEIYNWVYGTISEEPVPITIWIFFWIFIILILYRQRDKLTEDMKFSDFFRSRIRHNSFQVRLKAVEKIKDVRKLLQIARKDLSVKIKKAAIGKIKDQQEIVELARKEQDSEVATLLIKKIKNPEELARMVIEPSSEISAMEALKNLKDLKMLKKIAIDGKNIPNPVILLNKIKDEVVLNEILRETKSDEIKAETIRRMKSHDKKHILELALNSKSENDKVAIAAVQEIEKIEFLLRIIDSSVSYNIKAAAIQKIDDRIIIDELSKKHKDEKLRNLFKDQQRKLKAVYSSFKVEIECPFCSQPVFVNGPVRKTKCSSCQSEVAIGKWIWKEIKSADFGTVRYMGRNMVIEKKKDHPACSKCGEYLETDLVANNDSTPVICKSCGTENSSMPIPSWMNWSNFDHLFCVEHEGSDLKKNMDIKPIAISCIKCSAPLEVKIDTPRNATCSYCNTVQYLPDGLWLSMHPVKLKQEWYLRSSVKMKKMKK